MINFDQSQHLRGAGRTQAAHVSRMTPKTRALGVIFAATAALTLTGCASGPAGAAEGFVSNIFDGGTGAEYLAASSVIDTAYMADAFAGRSCEVTGSTGRETTDANGTEVIVHDVEVECDGGPITIGVYLVDDNRVFDISY